MSSNALPREAVLGAALVLAMSVTRGVHVDTGSALSDVTLAAFALARERG